MEAESQWIQIFKTRKSSCVNARGTPPAAYQVLAVLLCLIQTWSGGGTLSQVWGRVPRPRSRGGCPVPCPKGGHPIQGPGGTPSRPGWGVPHPDLGWGTPPSTHGTPPGQGTLPQTWDRVPPQTWDGVPFPRPGTGYPPQDRVPFPRPGTGYPPRPGMGYPSPDLGQGTPSLDLGWGTPDLGQGTLPQTLDGVPPP